MEVNKFFVVVLMSMIFIWLCWLNVSYWKERERLGISNFLYVLSLSVVYVLFKGYIVIYVLD